MIPTDNEEYLKQGSIIGFCPDLDRGAQFSIEKIDPLPDSKVKLFLKYIPGGGRWSPDDPTKLIELTVPEDFTTVDIECAWHGIPNMQQFTM